MVSTKKYYIHTYDVIQTVLAQDIKTYSVDASSESNLGTRRNLLGSVFTNHSAEYPLFYSQEFSKIEHNTTSDWLNQMV